MRLFILIACLCFLCGAVSAQAAPATGTAAVNTATMGALSPLLMLGALGVKARMAASDGSPLPFYASTGFLVCAGLLLFLLVFKDTLGELFPPVKKLLDVLDVLQNKVFAIAAALALLPGVAQTLKSPLTMGLTHAASAVLPTCAYAAANTAGGSLPAWVGTAALFFAYLLAGAAFFMVWGVSQAVNILILLAPVPLVGTVLKSLRLALLAALAVATVIHPLLGLVLSLLVLIIAVKTFGWTTRLAVFGTIVAMDVMFRRQPDAGEIVAFTMGITRWPARTQGRLSKADDALRFAYRFFFLGPLRVCALPVPDGMAVAPGRVCPAIVGKNGHMLFLLPPRYRGHEASVASVLRCAVVPSATGHGVRAVLDWVRETA